MATRVETHFDKISTNYDFYKKRNWFYYTSLKDLLSSLIPPSKKVLEVGCGTGDMLACLNPKEGYGMDISSQMVKLAKIKHKNLIFSTSYPHTRFEYIFMTDVIEHLESPEEVFVTISKLLTPDGVFINTMANPIWEPLLLIWEKMGLKMPEGPHLRRKYKDVKLIVERVDMKIIKHDYKLLIPIKIPFITNLLNRYLERHLKKFAFIEYFVAVKA